MLGRWWRRKSNADLDDRMRAVEAAIALWAGGRVAIEDDQHASSPCHSPGGNTVTTEQGARANAPSS
jgi:hypothetical protein